LINAWRGCPKTLAWIVNQGKGKPMDHLDRQNSELNLVIWAALFLVSVLMAGH
jgi:hypothetical protein